MQEISRTGASTPVREIAGVCNDIDIKHGTEKLYLEILLLQWIIIKLLFYQL